MEKEHVFGMKRHEFGKYVDCSFGKWEKVEGQVNCWGGLIIRGKWTIIWKSKTIIRQIFGPLIWLAGKNLAREMDLICLNYVGEVTTIDQSLK